MVSDSEILIDQNKINSVFCDETYTKYLILAFYEENAPSNQRRENRDTPIWLINKVGNGRDYVSDISRQQGW